MNAHTWTHTQRVREIDTQASEVRLETGASVWPIPVAMVAAVCVQDGFGGREKTEGGWTDR